MMHLGMILLGAGGHVAGWRLPGAEWGSENVPLLRRIAATAERGAVRLPFPGRRREHRAGRASRHDGAARAADAARRVGDGDGADRAGSDRLYHLFRAIQCGAHARLD